MSFSELGNVDSVQKRVWSRYGKLARKQGVISEIYRISSDTCSFVEPEIILPVIATYDFGFMKSAKYASSIMLGIFDGTYVKAGDYIVNPPVVNTNFKNGVFNNSIAHSVFFVASVDVNTSVLLIKCNRVVSVKRIKGPVGSSSSVKGVLGYSGINANGETILASNFPASVLQGTKGETNPVGLPLDVRKPWWTILLPNIPNSNFDSGDIITCDLGRNYFISSAEQTSMGWRITAAYERA